MKCTFFGHRNTSSEIMPKLCEVLTDLIENKNVDTFYVGNQGNFDSSVKKALKILKMSYPHIKYYVVLAYMPNINQNPRECYIDYSDSIYPEGLEFVPKRFAISHRNKWLVNNCDFVVTCVSRSFGGAAKFKNMAVKNRKTVIELNE